jgi:hypothetical protein
MDNSEISWTIRKFHGRYETPPSIDGQLSMKRTRPKESLQIHLYWVLH